MKGSLKKYRNGAVIIYVMVNVCWISLLSSIYTFVNALYTVAVVFVLYGVLFGVQFVGMTVHRFSILHTKLIMRFFKADRPLWVKNEF